MSLTTQPLQAPTARRRWFLVKLAIAAAGLLLLAFLLADLWFYRAVKASLPRLDGTVQLAGLREPVTVGRDEHGVPTIAAANLDDLFFAQGYVTAQDRLWQMDMARRFAAGDVAVVLGPTWVEHDRRQRIFGIRRIAGEAVARLSARDRAFFEAYARGVNAYIAEHRKTLPLEFRFLTYFPHAWTAEDSMMVGLAMYQYLNNEQYLTELAREKIAAKVGPELAADLYVNSSWREHPPGTEGSGQIEDPDAEMTFEEQSVREPAPELRVRSRHHISFRFPEKTASTGEAPLRPGSNNWVVSGQHTVTGRPLLSNDMHLGHQIPNTWYEAHLTSGDYDVAGVTLPGVPFVVVGHNRRIAWGFTNLGPDVTDVYIENFNQQGEYQTPTGWVKPEQRREIIRVKGEPEVAFDVVTTRHGPIISDLIPGESRRLALKWIAFDPEGVSNPFFDVNSARNWDEFRGAFAAFGGPSQNAVYADVDGHIGYQAVGRVPIRASGTGAVPVPGQDDGGEWTGYIPFDQMPSLFDPPSGIIATANSRIVSDTDPRNLSNEWDAPYRIQRIYRILGSGKKFSSGDMLALQMDVYSDFDRYCAERFVYAVDRNPSASEKARRAADLMRGWSGDMLADAVAPTIATFARHELYRMLLEPKIGDASLYRWLMKPVWLENVLQRQPQRWLPPGFASYDAVLAEAVERAVKAKGARRSLSLWTYGNAFPVTITHGFWGKFPIIKRGAGPDRQPQSGSPYTVKQSGRAFGPSQRLTVDLADLDRSTLNIVNGQSGNIFSDYFNDQWDAWYKGTTFVLPFSPAAVGASTRHRLRLEPAR